MKKLIFSALFIVFCSIAFTAGFLINSEKEIPININEKRIECMTKTLMIVYGLSKWESHYYSIIFYDFSKNYNIPWEIYPAIIRIESNFKTTLVSNKSARGLMQVMGPTAMEESRLLGIDYVEGQTLWNEICNIVIGCNYLSRMIQSKGLDGGVKCYLGGPSAAGLKATDSVSTTKVQYVSEYKTSVWKEYKELTYTFRGIVAESGQKYEVMHPCSANDSVKINTILF